VACAGQGFQNLVGKINRRRHEHVGFPAGVTEHQALVAGALVLVALGIDALRDVGGLGVKINGDFHRLPVEAVLPVADVLDRRPGDFRHPVFIHPARRRDQRLRPPDFAGEHDAVGGAKRLAGDAGVVVKGEKSVNDGIRNAVADFVRMSFRDRFTGKKIV